MMEEPLNQGTSPVGENNFPGDGDLTSTNISAFDERFLDIAARHSLNSLKTPPTKKAKRIRFFRNGDKFYTGIVMAVTPERYRSFDSLASDLTRALVSSVTLPNGVRSIYTMDGRKVQNISELEDGKCYVVSGQGEIFKKVEYSSSKVRRGSSLSGLPQSPAGTGRQISAIPLYVKARIVTLIRHGTKPRKVIRLLLNKRNAPSLEHAMEAITEAVKLDSGAVRKVYTLSGQQVTSLEQFFESEEIFVAYGTEKSSQDDFELDFEESKCVQSFRRCPWISKRQGGPMPRMPRKSGKKTLSTPQVRTPSPSSLMLPQPLRLHYTVGHVIGDGNFAIVRHCTHKATGAEYAIKIVDKYKCQGRQTMLASEVAILRQVCHPNIISLIAEQETVDQLFLVMELVKGGDLFDAIAAATKFSEAEASVMIGHLTSALAYLHSHQIVHRDVKPENLLVEMEGSHVRCLKLGDFGLAQVVREPLYTVCGTPTYIAPEILAETGYGLKIDVWAAGVILYILLCGFPPFVSPKNEQEKLFERILSGQYEFTSPYWDPISDSAKQLISNMLQAQPELRFSAEDVLDHPWLASFLGGEQTAATTITDSTQQHWDQQRKPIRLATFEFDFKKQRRENESHEEPGQTSTGGNFRGRWNKTPSPIGVSSICHDSGENDDVDVVDFANGNPSEEEPISLSADCLQDIHTLSQSMHNLINNLHENQSHRPRLKSSQSVTSSLSSIPENVNKSVQRGSTERRIKNSESSSAMYNRVQDDRNSISVKKHATKVKNGNSIIDACSKIQTPPSKCKYPGVQDAGTPKSAKTNRSKHKTTNFYLKIQECGINSDEADDIDNCIVTSSSGRLSDASSNDIETSESFVNIQYAQIDRGHQSSSTHSLESTDSFENINFFRAQRGQNDAYDPNENKYADKPYQQEGILRSNEEKSAAAVLQGRTGVKVQNVASISERKTSGNNASKSQDTTKNFKNEMVKLRIGKNVPTKKQMDNKGEIKSRRSSYVPYSSKTSSNSVESANKSVVTPIKESRKFSSTDELRDERQKPSIKAKRFSLYYTPQPSRKNYEAENRAGKETCKSTVNRTERQNNSKVSDASKRKDDVSSVAERKNNRRSVIDGTTVSSRSKSNKQNIHIKLNATDSNLTPGRTK